MAVGKQPMQTQGSEPGSQTESVEPRSSWEKLFRDPADWLLLGAGLALSPMLVSQAGSLWSKPHFQFFPLAIGVGVFLVWSRGSLGTTASAGRAKSAVILGGVGVLLGGTSGWLFSPWLAQFALLCFWTAWGLLRLGGSTWQQVLAWSSLFWITLPLPMDLDDRLIRKLQNVSTNSASPLMDLAGIPHLPSGNIIETKSGRLFVDEACSGVDSLYSLAAVVLLSAVWQRSSPAVCLLTLLTVPAWAWLGNTLRLFSIAYFLHYPGMDFAHGWKHTVLGFTVFGLMCLCMLLVQGAIRRILKPFPVKTVTSGPWHALFNRVVCWPVKDPARSASQRRSGTIRESSEPKVSQVASFAKRGLLAATISLLLIGSVSAFSFFRGPAKLQTRASIQIDETQVFRNFTRDLLPEEFNGLRLLAFDTVHRPNSKLFYGEHSAVWQYSDGVQTVMISLDFPFAGFHALEVCYVGAGCSMVVPRRTVDLSEYASKIGCETRFIEEVRLSDQMYGESYLCYAEFDKDGSDVWRLGNRLTGSLPARIAYSLQLQPATYQAQIYLKGCGRLTSDERRRYQEILLDACKALQPKVAALTSE